MTVGALPPGVGEGTEKPAIREVADLRPKNQVTIPREIVEAAGLKPGARLVFECAAESPATIRVRVLRESYAGALRGVFGRDEGEISRYLRAEREAWGE